VSYSRRGLRGGHVAVADAGVDDRFAIIASWRETASDATAIAVGRSDLLSPILARMVGVLAAAATFPLAVSPTRS
jgi:hypothetical protein